MRVQSVFAGVIVIAVLVLLVVLAGGEIADFISPMSLLLVVIPPVIMALANFRLREIGRGIRLAFESTIGTTKELSDALLLFVSLGRYVALSGVLGTFLGIIVMLSRLQADAPTVGLGLALSLITALYAVVVYMVVVLPLRTAISRKLNAID
jgi:flagellar motor component MotA